MGNSMVCHEGVKKISIHNLYISIIDMISKEVKKQLNGKEYLLNIKVPFDNITRDEITEDNPDTYTLVKKIYDDQGYQTAIVDIIISDLKEYDSSYRSTMYSIYFEEDDYTYYYIIKYKLEEVGDIL